MLEALFKADVRGLTIGRAQGHRGKIVQVSNYHGTTAKMELHEKVYRIRTGEEDVDAVTPPMIEGSV